MTDPLAEVKLACGRLYLSVAGIVVTMEGDKCRELGIPAELLDEIPAEELAQAVIGNRPAAELPLDIVRFFRGDQWNAAPAPMGRGSDQCEGSGGYAMMPPFDDSIARRRQRIIDLLFTHEAGSALLYGDRDPGFKTRWAARFREVARESAAAAQEIDPRPESEPDPLKDMFR